MNLRAIAAALALAAVTLAVTLAPATAWAGAQALLIALGWFAMSALIGMVFAFLAATWCFVKEVPLSETTAVVRPFWIVGVLTGAVIVGYYWFTT